MNSSNANKMINKRETIKDRARRKLEKQNELVSHLLDVGWISNHKWIENKKNEEIKQYVEKKDNDIDLEELVAGKHRNENHLISPCGKYTVRINHTNATFWQKDPRWIKLTEQRIDNIILYDKGIKVGLLKIEIEEGEIK